VKKILVLGGAHIDRRGMIYGDTTPGASNPGTWMEEPGGGGFNAARNLSRLGFPVRIISPRGGDSTGEAVTEAARQAQVEDTPFVFLDRRTPSYTAILERDGNLVIALADMDLYALFSPRRLRIRAVRDAMADAGMIVCDANLPQETLTAIAEKTSALKTPLAAIAISPAKVVRLKNCLDKIDLLFMNEAEARAITGENAQKAADWPSLLRKTGLRGGVVTCGAKEAVAFAGETIALLHPPQLESLRDVTGAGDALASGYLSAQIEGLDIKQCLRWGAAAAAITVQSSFATSPDLSRQNLMTMLGLVPEAQMLS
jgi:sugar/nucleoside kinase (ribokinase family)